MLVRLIEPQAAASAIATLREHLDMECMQVDGQGRYLLEFEDLSAIGDALDEIEKALGEDQAEDGEQ